MEVTMFAWQLKKTEAAAFRVELPEPLQVQGHLHAVEGFTHEDYHYSVLPANIHTTY